MYAAPYILAGTTEQLVAFALMAGAGLCALLWSVVAGIRGRSFLPLLALLGGLLALAIAPFWEINAQFVFASNAEPTAFTAFGRAMPLYLVFAFPAFFGWGSYLAYRLIREGATRAQLLVLPLAFFVADAALEIAGVQTGLWIYYGFHSWNPFGWPIYIGVLNATVPLVGGWLLVVLDRHTPAPGKILAVLAVPTAYTGVYAAAGWPAWLALDATAPPLVMWLVGAVTILISIGICWLVADATAGEGREGGPILPMSPPSSDPFPLDSPLRRLAHPR